MKQNTIIILLAVIATLLLVNLVEDRFPPTAYAQTSASAPWAVGCSSDECFAVSRSGAVFELADWVKTKSFACGNVVRDGELLRNMSEGGRRVQKRIVGICDGDIAPDPSFRLAE